MKGERNQTITFTSHQYGTVSYHCIGNYIPHSLPVEGGCSRSRSRTIYIGNGSLTLGSTRTCTNYIHPHPPHKSFAELFQKRPFPSSPPFPKLYPALSPRRRRMTLVSRSRTIFSGNGSLTLGSNRTCTNSTHPHPPHKSFAELFQKRPFPPSPPFPPIPKFHKFT